MLPDKKLIEQRFAKAASTYEEQAEIQHSVAKTLLAMLDRQLTMEPSAILEIGCCTGLLTSELVKRFPYVRNLSITDLSASFKPYIEEKTKILNGAVRFMSGDIETIEIKEKYDLIISSSTFHWIYDLPALFHKLHGQLNPKGILAFSIYGPENVCEITNITGIGLSYAALKKILAYADNDFEILASSDHDTEITWFPTPIEVLQHLRQTGVNALGSKGWTRKELKDFIKKYTEKYSGEQGVSLTYHPMYIIAQAKQ